MLSKKRALLFDVLGRASQQARTPVDVDVQEPVRPVRAERPPRPSRPQREAPPSKPARAPKAPRPAKAPKPSKAKAPKVRREWAWSSIPAPVIRWTGLSALLLVAITVAIWKGHPPADGQPPALQTNVGGGSGDGGRGSEVEPAYTYSVCALEASYKTPKERQLAVQRVQELVDFLGYHRNPVFSDVRGQDEHSGKAPGCGTFRIYVGSSSSRPQLFPIRDKLAGLSWKGGARPFRDASVKMIARRVGSPVAEGSSDER
jgi:hypothetical protein